MKIRQFNPKSTWISPLKYAIGICVDDVDDRRVLRKRTDEEIYYVNSYTSYNRIELNIKAPIIFEDNS